MLNIVISGSRFSTEREILKEVFNEVFNEIGYRDFTFYDCNEEITRVQKGQGDDAVPQKQREINQVIIPHCDWYILLAPTQKYGVFTFCEWEAALKSLEHKGHDQIVQVFHCSNPEESVRAQGINDQGEYDFDDFRNLCREKWGEQFFYDYRYDAGFGCLRENIRKEINNALSKNLLIRKHTVPRDAVVPQMIFSDANRAKEECGFDASFYLRREGIDDALDNQQGFTIVRGAPASGKTRAVYEYLKTSPTVPADARVLVVRNGIDALTSLHDALVAFDKWMSLYHVEELSLAKYYFIFDELNNILNDSKKILQFKTIFSIAIEKFGGRMIATTLPESLGLLKSEDTWKDMENRYQVVTIPKLYDEADESWTFQEEFESHFGRITHDKQVIGDYIKGLVGYNKKVKEATDKFNSQNDGIIGNFVKAYSTIRIFRRSLTVPIGLVMPVMEQFQKNGIQSDKFKDLLDFFKENNILEAQSDGESLNQDWKEMEGSIAKQTYKYDNEDVRMHISPKYIIQIHNDYIWERLVEEYRFKAEDDRDMHRAGTAFFYAFSDMNDKDISENPLNTVNTLHRVIVRCPSVKKSYYFRTNTSNNFLNFIEEKLLKCCEADAFWEVCPQDLCMRIACYMQRQVTFDEFKKMYEKFEVASKGRFVLDESVVAELLGFASYRNQNRRAELKEFLVQKGWDFSSDHVSIYYHRRMIEFLDGFDEVKDYMNQRVMVDSVLAHRDKDEGIDFYNRLSLASAVLRKFQTVDQASDWLFAWCERMNIPLSRFLLYDIVERMLPLMEKAYIQQGRVFLDKLMAFVDKDGATDISREVLIYNMITMSGSFQNALYVFTKYEDGIQNEEIRNRVLSAIVRCTRHHEFSLVYRFFFVEKAYPLPQISRNVLLHRLNVSDAIAICKQVFGSDGEARPDIYTLNALLEANLKHKKHSSSKEMAEAFQGNDSMDLPGKASYQDLLQILKMEGFENVDYDDMAINQIVQSCITESQEDYIVEQFVRPNYERQREKGLRHLDFETYWNTNRYLVSSRISRRADADFGKAFKMMQDYVKAALPMEAVRRGEVLTLNPTVINNTLNKLFMLYYNSVLKPDSAPRFSREDFNEYKKEIARYLFAPLSNGRSRIDYFIKDSFYYTAFGKVYPEEVFVEDQDGIRMNHAFINAPIEFLNTKFYGNILRGVLFLEEEKLMPVVEWLKEHAPDFSIDNSLQRDICQRMGEAYLKKIPKQMLENVETRKRVKESGEDPFREFNKRIKGWDKKGHIDKAGEEPFMKMAERIAREVDGDSMPNYTDLYKLVKNAGLHPLELLKLLEIVFLRRNLVVTPSLWKSTLEGVKKRLDKRNQRMEARSEIISRIQELKERFPQLLIGGRTTHLYELNIDGEEWRNQYFNKADDECVAALMSQPLTGTLVEYTELLSMPDLFSSFEQFAYVMRQYRKLSRIIDNTTRQTENTTHTYVHYIVNVTRHWTDYQGVSAEDSVEVREVMDLVYEKCKEDDLRHLCNAVNARNFYPLMKMLYSDNPAKYQAIVDMRDRFKKAKYGSATKPSH